MSQINQHRLTVHRFVEHDVTGRNIVVTQRCRLRVHVLQSQQDSTENTQCLFLRHRTNTTQLVCQNRTVEIIGDVVLIRTARALQLTVRYMAHDVTMPQLTAVFNLTDTSRIGIKQFGRQVIENEHLKKERLVIAVHYAVSLRVVVGFNQALYRIFTYSF